MKLMPFGRILLMLLLLNIFRVTATADEPLRTIVRNDVAEMVLIPSGKFQMGSSTDEIKQIWKAIKEIRARIKRERYRHAKAYGLKFPIPASISLRVYNDAFDDEIPRHTVHLEAFYIDKYEVTNAQYRRFIEATGHREPKYWNESKRNQPNQPVIGVSWHDAMTYATWAGKRLPTEAEWEYAARGGLVSKWYPWGDQAPDETKMQRHGDYVVPVGSYAPNSYGLFDVAGSVLEWCLDEYQANAYQPDFQSTRPKNNPFVGGSVESVVKNYKSVETERVLRGGAWDHMFYHLRVANRDAAEPAAMTFLIGFRCAKPVTP